MDLLLGISIGLLVGIIFGLLIYRECYELARQKAEQDLARGDFVKAWIK